ncbi:MAG TPA: ABC transporter ATP-binding protein [Candidatus Paceibacterota bacterium]|nr:ABC transporter ATP-binding protein [Candidatus Paceibacterota bacterium]
MPEETPTSKPKVKDVFREYIREAARFPWLLSAALFAAILSQVASLVSPLYMRQLFNIIAAGHPSSDTEHQLFVIVAIVAGISIVGWASQRAQTYSIVYLEANAMADLYGRAFDYLIRHSYQFFVSRFTGTLTRRVSRFASSFETILDSIILNFFPTIFFAVGAVGVLFFRNHILGIALAIWVVVFVLFQIFVARLRQPLRVARAEADSKVSGTLADAVANQNTIALFSGSEHEAGLFGSAVELWRKATTRSWTADEFIWSIQGFLMVAINVGLLYGAVIYWQKGMLTVGDFVLIQSYLLGLFGQLMGINWTIRRFYDAYADAVEMVEILDMPHEVQDIPNAPVLAVKEGEIAFKNVNFYFQEDRPVLDDFSITIPSHQKLALVGPSGAGKTTVTKLLLRLYDVMGGTIEIDGQNIAKVTQDSLRAAVAFVPQEPILFHRTLLENIRYGKRDATEEEVIEAAKKAHCHEFIDALPEKYDTYVGERGVKLSGGERQRVAIARAILKNAPILVLDEATSSLDSESEALIQDALNTLMQGKTVIVIAHRLSTIMRMDRIIVIEGGKVVAEGTHDDLLKQGGLYKKLWSIQAGGFRDDLAEKSGT